MKHRFLWQSWIWPCCQYGDSLQCCCNNVICHSYVTADIRRFLKYLFKCKSLFFEPTSYRIHCTNLLVHEASNSDNCFRVAFHHRHFINNPARKQPNCSSYTVWISNIVFSAACKNWEMQVVYLIALSLRHLLLHYNQNGLLNWCSLTQIVPEKMLNRRLPV